MTSEQIHIGNMSHETAIGILKLMLEAMETYDGISPTPARINAIKIAIEALEQEPTTKNDLGVDCISRADARSLICEIGIKNILGMSGKTFQDLYKGVDNLPSVTPQEPRGIPVSERLPKRNEEVLIYLYDRPYIAWFDDGEWQTDDFTIDVEEEPIAWMPLPKPYREVEE